MNRRIAAMMLLSLAGCSWFSRKAVVTPAETALAAEVAKVEPVAAARAACPNYDALIRESPYPRDAIIRGIDAGAASVVFKVEGAVVTVLSVRSSTPAFGNAAEEAARKLECAAERPARFSIAFDWHRSH